ncbi:CD209 antigen-like protein 2 [Triplophysa dalaica]|uniref:CD209 antigen-like protein 2 n=1 Tax=Triplophysa dalaica TaxID=1582913 RepID=UPI0024DF81AB|nr:CD209 antigen-like protein 2 [Triplophysa dalaica]
MGPAEVRTKVLLIVLCVSVVLLVGGLCVLGVLYFIRSYSCEPCEYGWTEHDGHCYLFSSEKRTYFDSRLLCLASDAHLVIINNAKEQHFLVSKAKEFFWIGLNDLETEGRWVWVNNQILNQTGVQFWHKRESGQSEPDNWNKEDPSGENCASIAFWDIFHTCWQCDV